MSSAEHDKSAQLRVIVNRGYCTRGALSTTRKSFQLCPARRQSTKTKNWCSDRGGCTLILQYPVSTTQVSSTGVLLQAPKILCNIRRPGEINGDPARVVDFNYLLTETAEERNQP